MADTAALAPFLDVFPDWLRTLGDDARELGDSLDEGSDEATSRYTVGGLNYIFKSLDLIPDGIDDLGFCDDAFVIRVAARLALSIPEPEREPVTEPEPETPADAADAEAPAEVAPPIAKEPSAVLVRLAGEASHVEAFLGADYELLVTYVNGLRKGAARGRTVDDILGDEAARTSFLQEVKAWAADYQVPAFTRDVKTLIKLKAFLSAKLG